MYYNPTDWSLDTRQLNVSSNCPVGFPRSEQIVALTDDKLHLAGPPIEINHPSEYNPLDYYCNSGSETLKYGVAGIYNVTDSSWITSSITDVDEMGIEISTSGSNVTKGDECIVYYYAKVAWSGGKKVSPIQGDLWSPAVSDVLLRKANDSAPSMFGYSSDDTGNVYEFAADMMYNTGVAISAVAFSTLLDYSGTGTFRQNDFPVYVTEIQIGFDDPATMPSHAYVRVTLDGEEIFREYGGSFGSYTDHLKYLIFDSSLYGESGGPYTESPSNISSAADQQMFFDIYYNADGKPCFRLPIECELLSDIKVEMYTDGSNPLTNGFCYVRGWFVD